ncbi:hypothetical protein EAI_11419 [Harpegnathos saltator]|uniref:Uncharacterized protein n=1 Tax=Harpegnathos saltator TaxID=610380 RepID=E2BYL4_HARSA|nr:hypothetical protein EAI_11419 [Harpegnathos saltator]
MVDAKMNYKIYGETERSDVAMAEDVVEDGAAAREGPTAPAASRANVLRDEARQDVESASMSSNEVQPSWLISLCIPRVLKKPRSPRYPTGPTVPEAQRLVATKNAYSQTYYKFLKNLTDNRCVDILNVPVNPEKPDTVFYRDSCEMLLDEMDELTESGHGASLFYCDVWTNTCSEYRDCRQSRNLDLGSMNTVYAELESEKKW